MRPYVAALVLLPLALGAVLYLAPEYLGASHYSVAHVAAIIGGASATGGSLDQIQKISELEKEVASLRETLLTLGKARVGAGSSTGVVLPGSTAGSVGASALPTADTTVPIPLMNFLGLQSFFAGVSWDPYSCFPPPKTVWPKMGDEMAKKLEAMVVQALAETLAKIKKVDVKEINTAKPYHELFDTSDHSVYTNDPDFALWRRAIMVTLSPYLVTPGQNQMLCVRCPKNEGRKVLIEELGTPALDCRDELTETQIIDKIGYYAMPYESVQSIAHGFTSVGICTSQVRGHAKSYAHWLKQGRMYNDSWRTFAVMTPDQDAAVLLFDTLYEKLAVFTRQYWMGVITMQNPFDMYSIQDILFETRPTLMIETGTANGGSALLWASVMHLSNLSSSRIITMDVNAPKWEKGHSWGGMAREDPTSHRLWKKHVTFIKGSTTDDNIVKQVHDAAAGQKVMALLDSHHAENHVLEEMERYCILVSVGCYCIVEDTKMSRWASEGPLEAVKRFLAGPHGNKFEMDRSRELLYSHHAMGYLKRKA